MLRVATSTSLRSPNAGSNAWLRSRSRITLSAAALRCGSGKFFSEVFDRPFGVEGATSPTGMRTSAPPARRPVEQVDITQFFSDATRELLQRAAQPALDWGTSRV